MKNKKNFWEWYVETSKTAGSLVTPSSAARMIGTSRAYMDKLASTGKIQKYYFHCEDGITLPFIGMNDINEIIAKRRKKIEQENDPRILELKAKREKMLDEIESIQRKKQEQQQEAEETPDDVIEEEIEKLEEEIKVLDQKKAEEEASEEITNFDPAKWREETEKS